ncbi:unnamed protein product [Coregonus sp. 'balchen']|nr:unnamed protein product [Coregonus sp. 'balchen']CAB1313829.1 unnamed protein product [Coregonus sp. 'balchen']
MDDMGESMMMTPEEKLTQYDSRAQAFADTQQDLVRCLVYEDGHLKLAQAHVRLAKAYLQFKGWAVQAQEHSDRASELLPLCSPSYTCWEDRLHVHTCLLNIYLAQGGATAAGQISFSHILSVRKL